MGINSTNEQHLAYSLSVGITKLLPSGFANQTFYTWVRGVEQVRGIQKKHPSLFLWLLLGGLFIGSVIGLMQLSALQSFTVVITSLLTIVLMVLLAEVIARRQQLTYSKRSTQATRRKSTRSEARYQFLAQNSAEFISRHTPEGIYLYASPACCTLLGYEPDELVGYCVYDFCHPQDLVTLKQSHANLLNYSESVTVSYRIRRQNGDYILWETKATPIRHPDTGVVEEIFAVSRDITERQQTCEALKDSEQKLQKLTANVPGMIYQFLHRTDGSMSFPFVSDGAREIYELEPTQIQQNAATIIDLIHVDERERFDRSIASSAKSLSPWKWEGRIISPSGQLKWLQAASQPQLQANGDILWNGLLMDITECKRASAALSESEEIYRAVFEQADVAIALLDSNGKFLRVNQKLCDITGYQRKELLTRTILEITCPQDQAISQTYLQEFFSGQRQTLNFEKCYLHKSGSVIWANVKVSIVRAANGAPKYCICVIEDITQRKQSQAELHRANQDRINLLESITEAFFAVDQEWQFTYINSKAEQFLLGSAKELLGKSVWDNFPHTVDSQFEAQFRRAVAEQVSIKFEEFYPPLNIWFVVRAYPYEGGLSVYFSDITERKQAEAALLERSHLSTLAANVGVALAEGGTLPAIVQRCTEIMAQQLDATSVTIWTLNPASQQLEHQATAGSGVPLSRELIDLVAQTRQRYQGTGEFLPSTGAGELWEQSSTSIPSYTTILSPAPQYPSTPAPPHHFSGYPLVVEDRLMGVMTLLSNQPLTAEASNTLSWVSNAIAIAIDRYWARSELLSRRESLLFELANQIRNSLELDTILETAVQSIRTCLQIDRCQFLWLKPHQSEPYWEVVKEARNPDLPSHVGQYKSAQVKQWAERFLNRQIIPVDQVETFNDPGLQQFLLDMGYKSLLSIPIRTQAGEIGVICCAHCTLRRPWEKSEVELLQAVVAQLAIALEQAELYAQARQAAVDAQAQTQKLELALKQLQATQAQLVQNEKMSSLGQLVAGVAHEINNPVNFIHGNLAYAGAYIFDILNLLRLYQEHYPHPLPAIQEQAELIDIDFIAKDLPKLLSSMQRGTERIRSIVLSLRNFTRADEADMKKVDLHEGIDSTLLILQHRLKSKGFNPEINVFKKYGNLPLVNCFPGELNQVFMNILSNAIEAFEQFDGGTQEHPSLIIPHPCPTITIRTSVLNSSNSNLNSPVLLPRHYDGNREGTEELSLQNAPQSVVIQIADNGPGMPESVRKRLFDPFFTTKPVGQGTGLGLSISYQIIVEHHQGVLTCHSTPGQGTEFWIEIPIEQVKRRPQRLKMSDPPEIPC